MRQFLFSFLLLLSFLSPIASLAQDEPVLVPWQSEEGVIRLERSGAKVDFFPLANHFESQENKIYCGVASSAIILNALRLDKEADHLPQDQQALPPEKRTYLPKGFDPIFKRYTQQNVITDAVKSESEILGKPMVIGEQTKADYGLQLRQLAGLLSAHNLNVIIRVVSNDMPEDVIREELIKNMQAANDYVLVNYLRSALGQQGSGHISPLGAYDAVSDSFLILDVNPNTAPWVWVKTHDLVQAMRTFDAIENRGYLLISDNPLSSAQ